MSFPNEAKTTTQKDGADITLADAQKQSSYPFDFTFNYPTDWFGQKPVWAIEENAGFPFALQWRDYPTPHATSWPNEAKTTTNKDGADITNNQSTQQATYSSTGWVFGLESWDITENQTRPFHAGFEPPPPPPSITRIKYWNGVQWVPYRLKYWNGTAWVEKPIYRWSMSNWV